MSDDVIIDYPGTYGGAASREEIIRALKEALALVEYTPQGTQLVCAGIRIEITSPSSAGTPPRDPTRS